MTTQETKKILSENGMANFNVVLPKIFKEGNFDASPSIESLQKTLFNKNAIKDSRGRIIGMRG